MDIDLQSLYQTVDRLTPEQRTQLQSYLAQKTTEPPPESTQPWTFDLAPAAIQTTPDFDEPLPDAFWLGDE